MTNAIFPQPKWKETKSGILIQDSKLLLPSSLKNDNILLTRATTSSIISRFEKSREVSTFFTRNGDDTFRTYADHRSLHTGEVYNKAMVLIKNRESVFSERTEKIVVIGVIYHDTGMSNGARKIDGKTYSGFMNTAKDCRKFHALMSGVEVLLHGESLAKTFGNTEDVGTCALLCASHSKSNSGLNHFDKGTMIQFVHNFKNFINSYEKDTGLIIPFNDEHYINLISNSPVFVEDFKAMSETLTLSDGFTHASDTSDGHLNQMGEHIGYYIPEGIPNASPVCYYQNENGDRTLLMGEKYELTKLFWTGEANVRYEETFWSKDEKVYDFHAKNCDYFASGIMLVLTERIKELPRFNENGAHVIINIFLDGNYNVIENSIRRKITDESKRDSIANKYMDFNFDVNVIRK